MIFFEPVRDGLLDMWAYKGRTVLQTLGVMLGSASVIVTIAMLMGGRQENREFLEASGGVTTLEVRKAEGGRKRLFAKDVGAFGVTLEDLESVRAAVEPLGAKVYAARSFSGEIATADGHQGTTVWGVTPEYLQIEKLKMEVGHYISYGEVETAQPVIVLGSKTKTVLFGNGDAVGKYVVFRPQGWRGADQAAIESATQKAKQRPDRRYLVIGVLAEKVYKRAEDQDNWLDWMNELAYVPLTSALDREIGGREVGALNVRARDLEAVRPTKRAMEDALTRSHRGVKSWEIFDRAERLAEWESQSIMYDAAIGGAGAISLLVGGIVIMNILLASLTQRIREVGIRKALGARNSEIFVQFLTESILVAAMGGVGGAIVGSSLTGIVAAMLEQKLVLTPFVLLLGVTVSATVGLFFGVYPAIRAARLDPVVALRYE